MLSFNTHMLLKKRKLCIVVNLRKTSEYDVYVGRAGHGQDGYFGSPFLLEPCEERGSTLLRYKKYFDERIKNDEEFKRRIMKLAGKRIACFCKPNACHADIIAQYVNSNESLNNNN